jgi:hypothetical protein
MSETEYVCSIDIGKKNFALTVEEVNIKGLEKLEKIPDKSRYNIDGTPSVKFQEVIDKVYLSGKIIYSKNHDLTTNVTSKTYLEVEVYYNMIKLLDSLSSILDKCSYFVVEQQMSFGKRHNTMALKLGQHCQSYFMFNYGRFKTVCEFPSYNKTQVLGAQKILVKGKYKAIDKPSRKKWSIVETKKILTLRKDEDTYNTLTSVKKGDDISDTITQLQAWKILHYIDKKI